MAELSQAQAKLKAVNDKLALLEKTFNEAVAEKAELQAKATQCQTRLGNADKLIGGLGGEKVRWTSTVAMCGELFSNLTGDVLVSAGTISYLGPFTFDYRVELVEQWREMLGVLELPHTPGCDIQATLADPVQLRSWMLCGLPTDSLSTQNGIMMDKSTRWPLLIDPQGQANNFIKQMGKNKDMCANGMVIIKPTDKQYLRAVENGIRFGQWLLMENIGEALDASLEPVLLKQTFKQGGQEVIRLGENTIPWDEGFRFLLTTKLSNPHYSPETQVKVLLINFSVTPSGLEEQLLNACVEEELPELAEKKGELVVENAAMNKQLYDIESQILFLLANSTGNILDDTELINALAEAKVTSEEIKSKMQESEATSEEIFATSEEYRPAAYKAAIMYFCIADLASVDPMYQYSLPWFTVLYRKAVGNSEPSGEVAQRLDNISSYFKYSLYNNVCRSLFESHKLLFSFLLCVALLKGTDQVREG